MNDYVEFILSRHSCRSFLTKEVEKEKLDLLVRAAFSAPSARGRKTWQFTVVQDKERLEELRAVTARVKGAGAEYDFYRPDALILCSNERDNPYGKEDCACAMENILLAAHALSLGAVWINQLNGNADVPYVREVLTKLGVPKTHMVYGCAAVGYPTTPLTRAF